MAAPIVAAVAVIAVQIGTHALRTRLAQKAADKRSGRVDKGRFDDIRLQTSELGGTMPIVKGKAKLAGNVIDHTPIVTHIDSTSTQQGSKKTGRVTTTTDNYRYTMDIDIAICAGPVSLVKIEAGTDVIYNAEAGSVGGFDVTGALVDIYDDLDPDDPSPNFNQVLVPDATGMIGAYLPGRNCHFAFYAGTENQVQDGRFVAVRGASKVPAYRGVAHCIFSPYQIPNGQIDNFFFTVDEGTTDLAEVVTDIYMLAGEIIGLDATDLVDASALSGLVLPGLVIPSQTPLGEVIKALEIIFGFSMIDLDGKIVAVKRGGAVVVSITEGEMAAYEEGGERPVGALQIEYINERELPRVAEVDFLDPDLGYHNNTAPGQIQTGNTVEPLRVVTPFVLTADAAQQAALSIVHQTHLEARPKNWTLGPEYLWLAPTDVVNLVMDSGTTHRTRITGQQQALIALGRYRGVPEQASVYMQNLGGYSGDGYEPPVVSFPANSFLVVMDVPPLRPEENFLAVRVAACPRGVGSWLGWHLYKEEISGEYERRAGGTEPATIGIVAAAHTYAGRAAQFDRDTEIVFDLFYDAGEIQSRDEAELLARPVNLLIWGKEVLQFATAVAETPASPYVARYRLSNLLHGMFGTDGLMNHDAGEAAVLYSGAVQTVPESLTEIGVPRNYKGVTVGQALEHAPVTEFTLQAEALKPRSPVYPLSYRNLKPDGTAYGDKLATWERRGRIATEFREGADVPVGEEVERYLFQIMNGATVKNYFYVSPDEAAPVMWRNGHETYPPDALLDNGGADFRVIGALTPYSSVESVHTAGLPLRFEAELAVPVNGAVCYLGLLPPDGSTVELDFDFFFCVTDSGKVWPEGLSAHEIDFSDRDRISILCRENGAVEYHRNYSGATSRPFYTSARKADIIGVFKFGAACLGNGVSTGTLRMYGAAFHSPRPDFCYTRQQQVADWGAVQTDVTVRISQVSALVGAGHYLETVI
ncbi:MAG: hypothetical protein QOG00_273 [Pyrinomonadaceae bacterium]|nr:hypothetical protein [Pyrinomonadaceae bacterium]